MAIKSGMFNSVRDAQGKGDRKYEAGFFASYFASFVGNGVFPNPSSGLQVVVNGNMTTKVGSGKGWINGYFLINEGDYTLQHDVADGVLKRLDRVVMKLDLQARTITIDVKKGTPASSPIPPSLVRDSQFYELSLASVLISNGAIEIQQSNITDERLNSEVCGIVSGLINQVDTTTIFNQYNSWLLEQQQIAEVEMNDWQNNAKQEFEEWYETVKVILDGDVAANLAEHILSVETKLDNHIAQDATLTVKGHVNHGTILTTLGLNWIGLSAPYTQVVSVNNILDTDNPIVSPVLSSSLSDAMNQQESYNMVSKAVTGTNTITFTCFEDKPAAVIPIQIKVVR